MPFRFPLLLTLFFVLSGYMTVSAQNKALDKMEQKLVEFYKGIYEDGTRLKNPKQKRLFLDSLEPILEARILNLLAMPGASADSFDHLRKKIRIVESSDKRLRFFSWNTEMGDAKNYIQVIAQYKDDEGAPHIKLLKPFGSTDKVDEAVDYWEIDMLADGSYLVLGDGKYTIADRAISITNFKITDHDLTDSISIFETEAGMSNIISVGYSIQVCDPGEVKVVYDPDAQTLCYPIMMTMARDKIIGPCASGENICLLYDGNIFKRKN